MVNSLSLSLRLQLYLSLPLPTIHPAGLQHRWKSVNRPGRFLCRLHWDRHKCGEEQSYNHIFSFKNEYFTDNFQQKSESKLGFSDLTVQPSNKYYFGKNKVCSIPPVFITCWCVGQSRWRLPDCLLLSTECQCAICPQRYWLYYLLIVKAYILKVICERAEGRG